MKSKECRHLLAQLGDYIDGEASQAICEEIEHHLAGCDDCRVVVDTLRKTVTLYRARGPDPLPDDVQSRLYRVLDLPDWD